MPQMRLFKMKNILSNEKYKEKAIKYVIQRGKNKKIPNKYCNTEQVSENSRSSSKSSNNLQNNALINTKRRQKTTDIDFSRKRSQDQNESQNEESSSLVEEERVREYRINPDPFSMNKINIILQDKYEKTSRRPQKLRSNIRNIQAIPQMKKNNSKPILTNYNDNYGNNNYDENDDIDELLITIEHLQSIIQKLTIDNSNKIKEINNSKKDSKNIQKELRSKRTDYDNEIDDIFIKDIADSNQKLKEEYFKLLQEYDDRMNDFNELSDNYNQIIDEK